MPDFDDIDLSADRGNDFAPAATPATPASAAAPAAAAPKADDAAPKADDAAPKADDTPEPQRDDKGRFIPKARFDEAVNKERERREALERENAELRKAQQQQAQAADVNKLEAQLVELRKAERKALIDGDEDKSAELAIQIDRMNRQISRMEAQDMSSQSTEAARESVRVDMTIERLENAYPQLKEGSEEFDQQLVDWVLASQQQLMQRDRLSPSAALAKAAADIMARVQRSPAPEAAADAGLKAAKTSEKTADRDGRAATKAVDAATRTPPDLSEVGLDTDKAGMKDGMPKPERIEDLAAIPEATLRRMRGDMA